MISILHIVSSMDPKAGGVSQAVRMMIRGLDDHFLSHEVVTLDNPLANFVGMDRFPIHPMGPGKSPWKYSPRLERWLKKNLEQFDILIIHGLWQYHTYSTYKAWKACIKKPKVFVMPHGMLDPYFQRAKGRRLKAIRNKLFWVCVEKHIINRADCLLFTCEMEQILASQNFSGYSPRKTEVIGLGIPPPSPFIQSMNTAFRKKCSNQKLEDYLLYISRIDRKKGIDLLITAYNGLIRENAEVPKLVIAGPGLETPFGKQVQALACGNGNIIFTGMLEGEEKWGAFYNCSAMILPSHQENFGFVVTEAMACGKPVLITNQVNIWKEVEIGKAGLIGEDTEQGIKDLLNRWQLMSNSEREEMGYKARLIFSINFSLAGASGKLKTALLTSLSRAQ